MFSSRFQRINLLYVRTNTVIMFASAIAIKAKNLKTGWKIIFFQPQKYGTFERFEMFRSVVIDMINRQKTKVCFSTA